MMSHYAIWPVGTNHLLKFKFEEYIFKHTFLKAPSSMHIWHDGGNTKAYLHATV